MLRKYWERNLSVIPVIGKRPIVKDWSVYCTRLPTEQEVELWSSEYRTNGVGLACGPASNVIILDIDIDDAELKALCPTSPLIKVGKPGKESRFFRYSEEIQTTHLDGVDILSVGSQTVLPPSIHPETNKPYYWLTIDNLENFDVSDLPTLKLEDIEKIKVFLNRDKPEGHDKNILLSGVFTHENSERCPHGSQARLKALCAALIEQLKTSDEIIQELIKYDRAHHKPIGYFRDKTRSDSKADEYTNALNFYGSILRTTNTNRIRKGLEPQTPKNIELKSIDISSIVNPPPVSERHFPESNGLIRAIQQIVLRVSRSKQEEMALGSAIAMLSAISSNRFHIMGKPAITHQYIMNVARSGQGKGAGFHIANKLFGPGTLEKYNLVGLRNYSSISAFVTGLPSQRSRLDMIDEFSSVLESFSSGSQISKEMESILAELYTDRGEYWKGHFTKTNGYTGGCFSPAVTVYANIQEDTLVNTAKKSMIDSGLMSRFLYFSGKGDAEYNHNYNDPIDLTELMAECCRVFPFYAFEMVMPDGTVLTDMGRVEPRREPLLLSSSVKEYRNGVDFDLYKKEQELDAGGDVTGAIFLSRFLQIAERIAIVNAVGCDRREITKDDYDYGMAVVRASSRRSNDYLRSIGAGSKLEKKTLWAIKALKKHGYMTHSKMLRYSNINAREFKELTDTLKQSEQIVEFKDSKSGALCYKLP